MTQHQGSGKAVVGEADAALRAKLTAILLQIELAQEVATDPRQRVHLAAAARAAWAAAELLGARP